MTDFNNKVIDERRGNMLLEVEKLGWRVKPYSIYTTCCMTACEELVSKTSYIHSRHVTHLHY